jgi:hypothetical protein
MEPEEQIDVFELIKDINVELTDTQVEILMALSDNKGYSLTELADMNDRQDTYLSGVLGKLSSYQFGDFIDSWSIQSHHVKEPLSLVHKLQDKKNYISKYIFNKFNFLINGDLVDNNIYVIAYSLAICLDRILFDQNLYTKERFAGIILSEDAIKLIAIKEKLKGGRIRVLNRILLEDSYPNEICKTRISLIHKSFRNKSEGSTDPYFINLDLRTFNFIAEYLIFQIKMDRCKLEEMETRRNFYLRGFGGFERFFSPEVLSNLEKQIKDGKNDVNFFRKRYNKNINILWNFMISNYVTHIPHFGFQI